MKPQQRDPREVLEKSLDRFRDPAPTSEQTESAGERVLQRLRLEVRHHADAVHEVTTRGGRRRKLAFAGAFAGAAAAAVVLSVFLYKPDVSKVRIEQPVANPAIEIVRVGQTLRTSESATAQYALEDGSLMELATRSELSLESAEDGVRLRLRAGAVIVTAAKQRTGHLYVQTPDCLVSVVGTVFLVRASEKGSQVAVIQGEVQVQKGTELTTLLPGQQTRTDSSITTLPIPEEISWSRNAPAHIAMLQRAALPGQSDLLNPQAPPPPALGAPPPRLVAPIPESGDASIGGLVRRLDTGEPLAALSVELLGLPEGPGSFFAGALRQREIKTDADGRFLFEKLPASTYTVRITPRSFFAPPVGGTSPGAATASVTVNAGQRVSNLALGVVPGGVIHGLIRDDEGRPAANISVWALRLGYRNGRRTLENAKAVQSNDGGEFRLLGMAPGEYYVRASGTVKGNPVFAYYPGGNNVDAAALVRVLGGDEIPADFSIPPTPLFRISGTVVNAIPELATFPEGFVLMPRNRRTDDGTATILPSLANSNDAGAFEIRALPGSYDLMPAARAIGAGNNYYYTARVPIEVRDRNVEGLAVTISRGAELKIQVNARAVPSISLTNMRLGLRPVDAFPSPLAINFGIRPLSPEGNVQFGVVPEGTYALVIPATTPGVYISDIRQGGRSVLDSGTITVGKETADPVEVVLSADGGRIEGTVEGADKSSTAVRVSLIPEGARRENLLLYRRAPLVQGRFTLTDIPPGNYKLFAWEDLLPGADENAEFMAAYESRGRAMTVRPGGISDVILPLIRR